jgi:hypothetical protein
MTDPKHPPPLSADPWLDGPAERPFTPPAPVGLPWLVLLLILAGAGLIGVSVLGPQASLEALRSARTSLETVARAAMGVGEASPAPVQPPQQPGAPEDVGTSAGPGAAGTGTTSATEALPERPAARRCVRDGHTTFTDGTCPDGASTQALALPVAPSAADAPGTVTLYRCRSHDGGFFWTRTHCHRQGARIDRMTRVPAELSQVQQIRLAEQQRLEARALTQPPVTPRVRVAQSPSAHADPSRRCEHIARRIEVIDSLTRQALSGPDQDRLRVERQGLRDEQFDLRCR